MLKDSTTKRTGTARSGLFYGYIIAIAAFCILLVTYGVRFSYGIFLRLWLGSSAGIAPQLH